jgi:acyl-CoA thioesterase-1
MTKSSTLVYFLLLLLVAAPAHAVTRNLLVIGDSLSAAYGLSPEQGWVRLLQQRLDEQGKDYRVINASITGDTTHGGLTRLPQALQRHRPSLVIIELGGNDGLRGFDLDSTRNNLRQMIREARAQGAEVLLLGVRLPANYGETYNQQFSAVFTGLAESEQVPVVPAFMLGVADHLDMMQADGIHPSGRAQPRLLDNVWPTLAPLLDASRTR